MSDFEVCAIGTQSRLALVEAFASALRQQAEQSAQRLAQVEAERDAVLIALEKIAGFTLSQFMGPHDMAQTCVTVARAASSAARSRR